jgi:hypothetical protein
MHISEFKKAVKPSEAIVRIAKNYTQKYIWFAVINKTGSKFEIGGYNENGRMELKASIPFYKEDGEPEVYPINDYVKQQFEIVYNLSTHPKDGLRLPLKEFVKAVKNKDFRKSEKVKKEKIVTETIYYTEIKL